MTICIYNGNACSADIYFNTETVDLGIYDPPFGIKETTFNRHYKRDKSKVIGGYVEAPEDYYQFSYSWIKQAVRVLKQNGSMYIISGWSNLRDILNAAQDNNLYLINHIVWKYNFGVFTRKKFVTSHYHILYYKKDVSAKPTFNTYCRFGQQEKDEFGGSLLYQDLEDVWTIRKEYAPDKIKNSNKLPDSLLMKLILYSSSPNDVVMDMFQGNFTTAYNALLLGRKAYGLEVNKTSYDYHIDKLNQIDFGSGLNKLKKVTNHAPANQGKPITEDMAQDIVSFVRELMSQGITKKDAITQAQVKYGRGKFSIINILDAAA